MAIFLNRLLPEYDRAGFDCGTPELNGYLQRQASQDEKKNVARVFVLTEEQKHIVGYFTLSQSSVHLHTLPDDMKKKLPRYPSMPCSLLGRLAVSVNYKGQGYGRDLLYYAMKQTVKTGQEIASIGLVVDAKDEKAKVFYEKYSFIALTNDESRLILPIKNILALIEIWDNE